MTGPAYDGRGTLLADGEMIFTRGRWDHSNGSLIVHGQESVSVVAGNWSIVLACTDGERGELINASYIYPDHRSGKPISMSLGVFALPVPGTFALGDIVGAEDHPPSTQTDALAAALAAAAASAASALFSGQNADRAEQARAALDEMLPLVRGFNTRAEAEAYTGDLSLFEGIQTLGLETAFDGGAAAYLRTTTLINGGFEDMEGQNRRPTLDHPLRPETFGPTPDGYDQDHSQAVFDCMMTIQDRGRGVMCLAPSKTYSMGDAQGAITIDPRSLSIDGQGATFNFPNRTFDDPSSQVEKATSWTFASNLTGWTQNPYKVGDVVWSAGNAQYSGTAANAGDYAGIGQAFSLVKGKRYRVIVETDYVGTSAIGQHHLSGSFQTGRQDTGASLDGSGIAFGSVPDGTPTTKIANFTMSAARGTFWFNLKGNTPFRINSIAVKELPFNIGFTVDGSFAGGVSGQPKKPEPAICRNWQ